MSSLKLIINPFAELDLQVAYEWYDLKKEGLGKEFLNEVEITLDRVHQNPHQFQKIKKQIRMAVVKHFPFGVFYFVKNDVINVFAIFHFSRNPQNLKKRL